MEIIHSDTTLELKIIKVLIVFIVSMITTHLTKCMKLLVNKFDIEQKGVVNMTLRDIYCYTPNTQKFIIFSESDRNDDLCERVPIFKGYLENCSAELIDEIVDHFLVGANRTIIVVLCI